MNKSKSFSSLCHSCQSSCSEVDKVSMGNLTDLNVSLRRSESCDNKFVSQRETPSHTHFKLLDSEKKPVMKLKFKKDLKVRIKGNCLKRQELDKIEQTMAKFGDRNPDFGYEAAQVRYEEQPTGWNNILDYLQNTQKYEYAENKICERHCEMKMERDKMLQEAKVKAVEKKIIFKCKGAFKNVLDNHVEKKSKHQILMEGVNKLSLENKEAGQFLAKQKQTHELRKLAEQAKQDAHEKRCQESQRPSWFENSVNNKIVDQKASQKGLLRFDELRKSGAIKIETPRRKIIIRKSAPQQF